MTRKLFVSNMTFQAEFYRLIKIDAATFSKFKIENHADASSFLSKLAEVESNNNENELPICGKFLSKQIVLEK